MAQTAAERQATYRKRHPEKAEEYKKSGGSRRSAKKFRDTHGSNPISIGGTPEYIEYRKSERYLKSYLNGHLKRKYGITLDEYNVMFEAQDGKCKICKGTVPNRNWKDGRQQRVTLFVDHCHATGKIRGLLCNKCNVGLAALNDDLDILRSAIDYIISSGKGDIPLGRHDISLTT